MHPCSSDRTDCLIAALSPQAAGDRRIVAMTENSIALLPDRGIVEVEGSDAVDFLQSLLTNDVEQAAPGAAIFAGLLTPQGKIQLDFLVYAASPERFLLDCPRASSAELAKRMALYKLRAKVNVADRSAEMAMAVGDSD